MRIIEKEYMFNQCLYPWFATDLSGCGEQCQPPTSAGSDNGIDNIFLCVVPPKRPP